MAREVARLAMSGRIGGQPALSAKSQACLPWWNLDDHVGVIRPSGVAIDVKRHFNVKIVDAHYGMWVRRIPKVVADDDAEILATERHQPTLG